MSLRPLQFTRQFTQHAEGAVLIEMGLTRVLCTASIEPKVPSFLKQKTPAQGWLTAEYGMLPRATHSRSEREASKGKQTGRSQEIQRLIGRALRSALDLQEIPGYTITLDCDVLQADGGTRTAAINGALVALYDALELGVQKGFWPRNPLRYFVAAVSVGMVHGAPWVDLDYARDSTCDTDLNVVMNEHGGFIEIQGTAEGAVLQRFELDQLLNAAAETIARIIAAQKNAVMTPLT